MDSLGNLAKSGRPRQLMALADVGRNLHFRSGRSRSLTQDFVGMCYSRTCSTYHVAFRSLGAVDTGDALQRKNKTCVMFISLDATWTSETDLLMAPHPWPRDSDQFRTEWG